MIALPQTPGGFGCLLVDPPWPERGGGRIKRGADRHYKLMVVRDIAALPVAAIAADNAHLYLYATNNFLIRAGAEVMPAWGFRYVTCISWFKDRTGLGQYFRGKTEHCLFGVRGKLPYRTLPNGKRAQGITGFSSPRGEHSAKPEDVARMAEVVSYGPYLELFARRYRPGWTCWGDQLPALTEAA